MFESDERGNVCLFGSQLQQDIRQEVCCDVGDCRKTFRNRKALYDHKVAVHRLLGSKRCQKCSKEFAANGALRRHMRTHDGYRCPNGDCEMVFTNYVSLRQHVARVHRKRHLQVHKKHVSCPASGCTTKLHPSRLVRHLKVKHAEMLVDQRKSSALTKFCQRCGAGFANGRLLACHENRMHNDEQRPVVQRSTEKPFACDVADCGLRFGTFMRLEEHKNLHVDIKPFQCMEPGCNRSYALRASLQRHMKTFHLKTMAPYAALEKLMTTCQL
uniref:C2H2-type domain-containing protein n=1 Tax=Trichuris muris TaxID=70415 RepID=A0A5S6R4W5_TRIMR